MPAVRLYLSSDGEVLVSMRVVSNQLKRVHQEQGVPLFSLTRVADACPSQTKGNFMNSDALSTKDVILARQADRAGRRIQVFIVVKTAPTPSKTYVDTVCVAGLVVHPGPLRWVRLYPVPFRHLDFERQFPKYSIVEVDVTAPTHGDGRPESLRVKDFNRITVLEETRSSSVRRHEIMGRVEPTTACVLNRGARIDPGGATSLGLVVPIDPRIEISVSEGWSESQKRTIELNQAQLALDLGATLRRDAFPLESPPFQAWYIYRCEANGCRTHRQGILDWELTALQRRAQKEGGDVWSWIKDRFETVMLSPDRSTRFVLGNQASGHKRHTFSVLSVYYPKKRDVSRAMMASSVLF